MLALVIVVNKAATRCRSWGPGARLRLEHRRAAALAGAPHCTSGHADRRVSLRVLRGLCRF